MSRGSQPQTQKISKHTPIATTITTLYENSVAVQNKCEIYDVFVIFLVPRILGKLVVNPCANAGRRAGVMFALCAYVRKMRRRRI